MQTREKRKRDLIEILGGKCQICGFNAFPQALEFHHQNPKEKSFSISEGLKIHKNFKECLKEIKKCYLLCANCHRGVHAGYYQNPIQHIYNEETANEKLKIITLYHGNEPTSSICPQCGKKKSRGAKLCAECNGLFNRKVQHPSREELKNMIRTMTFTEIARKYNIHRESVRKWCKNENLPDTKKEINSYSDDEWNKI